MEHGMHTRKFMQTHVDHQISRLYVSAPNHRVREVGLDGDGIPEPKKMSFLGQIINIYLGADDDLRRYDVDAHLYIKIAHLRSDVRVVF